MATATKTPTTPPKQKTPWLSVLGAGALAGLIAAFALTAMMALLRWLSGVPTVAELIGDVFIPSLTLDQFFVLIGRFDGGNGIKRVGIGSVLLGQLVVGTLVGLIYSVIAATDRARGAQPGRFGLTPRAWGFILVLGVVAWLGTLIPLRSVLFTNYRGLPATPATIVSIIGILIVYATFGIALVAAHRALTAPAATTATQPATGSAPVSRRIVLVAGAGAITGLAAGGLVRMLYNRSTLHYDGTRYRGADVQPITPNDRFYSVTKNVLDPNVIRAAWRLRIDGRVANPRTYTFDELAALPGVKMQEATVSCISNDVGDGLASNAIWQGISLQTLLEAAGIQQPTVKVVFYGADNYTDTILLDKALDGTTFVAWEMNGEPLPKKHGYPVRIIVPGRFGEKSVKWVNRIEVVDHDVKGFYERQGWGPTFLTQTFSRFDEPFNGQPIKTGSSIHLHGIAFAGDRGIDHVEISTDDGKTFRNAKLDYQTSKIAWVLWSLDWQPTSAGEYKLAVRAVDATGAYQTSDSRGIVPDGATGYHRITVRAEG